MAWYDPGDWNWDAVAGPLSLAGTGLGVYSNWKNSQNQDAAWKTAQAAQRDAFNFAKDQANLYNNNIANYMGMYADYRNQQAEAIGSGLGQMFSMMSAPLAWQDFYKPLTDTEVSARRRGATAQASLRTGGNEGAYIDDLVSDNIAEGESARVDRAIDAATRMRATQMQGLGPMASLLLGQYGAPPLPIMPMQVGYPNFSAYPSSGGGPMGSTDPLGQFLAWMRARKAQETQSQQTSAMDRMLGELRGGGGTVSPYGVIRTTGPAYSLYGDPNAPWYSGYDYSLYGGR